MHKNALI